MPYQLIFKTLLIIHFVAALGACAEEAPDPIHDPIGDDDEGDDDELDTEAFEDDDDDDDMDGDTDPTTDADGDGFSDDAGDCDDKEPFINPDAIEDLGEDGTGDEVDNDCDGQTDEIEPPCDDAALGDSALDLAAAMNLCDERFLLSVEKAFTSKQFGEKAYDTIADMGSNDCLTARVGAEMTALSTGPVGQLNPNDAQTLGEKIAKHEWDPVPAYQGDEPADGETVASCDNTRLELELKAPANAQGFSFDFVYGSAEYDEFIDWEFNDTFYAIMEYESLNGGESTNIAFDKNNNEIEVDSNFFENTFFPCDESGSGWEPEIDEKSGSTGWLRTTRSIDHPGDQFALTFSIHDEGDCIYDSIAFIDNFRWLTHPVDNDTVIVE